MRHAPLLIHAGFHKTGTSSIQSALLAHRATWADHLQIMLRDDLGPLPTACRQLSRGQIGGEALRASALQALGSIRADGAPLILSCEDLAGAPPGRPGVMDYGAAVQILPVLAQVLRPLGRPLHMVFTTRAAQPWFASLWWQNLRATRFTLSEEAFAHTYAKAARFDLVTGALRSALPDCPVHSFALEDSLARPSGPIAPLLDLAGLPPLLWPASGAHHNARPALGLAEVFLALNRSALPDPTVEAVKKTLLRKARRMQPENT